jgi:hypothetical protein
MAGLFLFFEEGVSDELTKILFCCFRRPGCEDQTASTEGATALRVFVWRCKMKSYRVGDRFEIVEDDKGKWEWRGWIGFNNIERGKCFVEGNILFISEKGSTLERGVTKEDFEGHLKSLPQWTKTKYYCPSYTLHICETGRRSSR